MRIFITGAGGFTGQYLVREFTGCGKPDLEVVGLLHENRISDSDSCRTVQGDLLDFSGIRKVISEVSPEIIIHLAGSTKGNFSELMNVNVVGTENLLNSVVSLDLKPRILIVGSSAEYGYQGNLPINETARLMPLSHYGISKAGTSLLSLMYCKKFDLQICIARPFNLVGPGQDRNFFCGNLISQVIACDQGKKDSICLINPNSRRDYVDVRDVVRAYGYLALHPGFETECSGRIFNIGSGISHSVHETFELIERITGNSCNCETPPPSDDAIPNQVCDYGLIRKVTGWEPEISFEESLRDMVRAMMRTA